MGVGFYDPTGESIVVTAEPAWFWTDAKPNGLPIDLRNGREGLRHAHRGRVVSLLFDIRFLFNRSPDCSRGEMDADRRR